MQLTDKCDLWRMVGTFDGGKRMGEAYSQIECLRVPVSEFDKFALAVSAGMSSNPPAQTFRSMARQATFLFWVPSWVAVREDDELRYGRRTDLTGAIQQQRFTVEGVRDYGTFAYQDVKSLYCLRKQSGA